MTFYNVTNVKKSRTILGFLMTWFSPVSDMLLIFFHIVRSLSTGIVKVD